MIFSYFLEPRISFGLRFLVFLGALSWSLPHYFSLLKGSFVWWWLLRIQGEVADLPLRSLRMWGEAERT